MAPKFDQMSDTEELARHMLVEMEPLAEKQIHGRQNRNINIVKGLSSAARKQRPLAQGNRFNVQLESAMRSSLV